MRSLLIVLPFVFVSACSSAQRTQQELEGQLVHKSLFLRGLWKRDKLHFSADGVMMENSELTSPLLSGVEITKVELEPKELRLSGRRLAPVYRDQQPQPMDLNKDIRIEVDAPAGGDCTATLSHVFTDSLADLAPSAPEYWKNFLEGNPEKLGVRESRSRGGEPGEDKKQPLSDGLKRIGGVVTPPRVLSSPPPEFPEAARRVSISGDVLVYLRVGKDGLPYHIRILRPLGLGCDEKAAEAVAKYKFNPSMENGEPVPVEMNVVVNFQVF